MSPARHYPKEEQEEVFGGEVQEHPQAKLDHLLVHQALVVDQVGRRKGEENAKESA